MKKMIMAIGLIAVASCSKKEQPLVLKNVAYTAHVTKFKDGTTWVYVEHPKLNK
jgi:hypothetical protein